MNPRKFGPENGMESVSCWPSSADILCMMSFVRKNDC